MRRFEFEDYTICFRHMPDWYVQEYPECKYTVYILEIHEDSLHLYATNVEDVIPLLREDFYDLQSSCKRNGNPFPEPKYPREEE